MHRESLKVKTLCDNVPTLSRAYDNPACTDISIISLMKVDNGIAYFGTGISMEIPHGFYVELHGRSSLHKYGWTLANSVGIIDEDYRGEIIVALQPTVYKMMTSNIDDMINELQLPLKVCQIALRKKYDYTIEYVNTLSSTSRGDGSFGSST